MSALRRYRASGNPALETGIGRRLASSSELSLWQKGHQRLGYAGHRQYFKPTFPILTIIGQPHDTPTSLGSGALLFVSGPAGNPFAAASSARRITASTSSARPP